MGVVFISVMPPKRKRGGGAGRGRGGKKAKTSADDDEDVVSPPAPTAAVATRSKGRGRKAKQADDASDVEAEPEPEPEVLSTTGKMIESLKKAGDKKRTPKVDQLCPWSKYNDAKVSMPSDTYALTYNYVMLRCDTSVFLSSTGYILDAFV